ncbi:hypothetical protein K438DRAFT_1781349 [Mycena galopus ATCC 62051]|nr:hypothetical protein K438DRAFT_1781349 [Mycena galopus ATCC 62051]
MAITRPSTPTSVSKRGALAFHMTQAILAKWECGNSNTKTDYQDKGDSRERVDPSRPNLAYITSADSAYWELGSLLGLRIVTVNLLLVVEHSVEIEILLLLNHETAPGRQLQYPLVHSTKTGKRAAQRHGHACKPSVRMDTARGYIRAYPDPDPRHTTATFKLLTPCKLMRTLARRLGDRRDFRLALCTRLTQNGRLVRPFEPKVLKSKRNLEAVEFYSLLADKAVQGLSPIGRKWTLPQTKLKRNVERYRSFGAAKKPTGAEKPSSAIGEHRLIGKVANGVFEDRDQPARQSALDCIFERDLEGFICFWRYAIKGCFKLSETGRGNFSMEMQVQQS